MFSQAPQTSDHTSTSTPRFNINQIDAADSQTYLWKYIRKDIFKGPVVNKERWLNEIDNDLKNSIERPDINAAPKNAKDKDKTVLWLLILELVNNTDQQEWQFWSKVLHKLLENPKDLPDINAAPQEGKGKGRSVLWLLISKMSQIKDDQEYYLWLPILLKLLEKPKEPLDINTAPQEGNAVGKSILWFIVVAIRTAANLANKRFWSELLSKLIAHCKPDINAAAKLDQDAGVTILWLLINYIHFARDVEERQLLQNILITLVQNARERPDISAAPSFKNNSVTVLWYVYDNLKNAREAELKILWQDIFNQLIAEPKDKLDINHAPTVDKAANILHILLHADKDEALKNILKNLAFSTELHLANWEKITNCILRLCSVCQDTNRISAIHLDITSNTSFGNTELEQLISLLTTHPSLQRITLTGDHPQLAAYQTRIDSVLQLQPLHQANLNNNSISIGNNPCNLFGRSESNRTPDKESPNTDHTTDDDKTYEIEIVYAP